MQFKKSLAAPILAFVVLALTVGSRFLDISALQNYDRDNIYLTVIVLQLLIFVLPGIFYCKLRGTAFSESLRIRVPSAERLAIAGLLFLTMLSGSILLKLILSRLTGSIYSNVTALNFRADISAAGLSTPSDAIYTLIAFALMPAVTQEFLFRGVLTAEYRTSGYGIASMLLIPSLLYAFTGASVIGFPVYFLEGLILACALIMTDSLLIPMALVFLKNVFELFWEGDLLMLFGQSEYFFLLLFFFGSLFLLFTAASLHETERLFYNSGVAGKEIPAYHLQNGARRAFCECLFSPTFLLCVAGYITSVFIQRYL